MCIRDRHGIDAVVEISHQLLKARPVKNIAGKAVILIPPVDDCAMCLGVLAYNQLDVYKRQVVTGGQKPGFGNRIGSTFRLRFRTGFAFCLAGRSVFCVFGVGAGCQVVVFRILFGITGR